jgi:hypothetical protein
MKKLAVFVEGQTEQIFVEKLLIEIAGANKILFEKSKAYKDVLIREGTSLKHPDQKYYVLLVNCAGDERVKSKIRDTYEDLVNKNYVAIIGLRDVFPQLRSNIPQLQRNLYKYIKTKPIKPELILSIMEIEAWFLAEHSHFEKIHKGLTLNTIKNKLKFHPSEDDMQLLTNPAADLDRVYQIVGYRYTKELKNSQRTINKLDYAVIYLELISKLPPLEHMVRVIDKFLED